MRAETAKAYARVGNITALLGEPDRAEPALRKALLLFQGLVFDHPQVMAIWYGRLDTVMKLADLLASRKDTQLSW